jgi:hypothetical protein
MERVRKTREERIMLLWSFSQLPPYMLQLEMKSGVDGVDCMDCVWEKCMRMWLMNV